MSVVSACRGGEEVEHEVEIHGLADTVTSDDLMTCFASVVKVKGLLLQHDQTGNRYARLWLWSKTDKEGVLALQEPLAKLNLTIREKEEQTSETITSSTTYAALTPAVDRHSPSTAHESPVQIFPEFKVAHNGHVGRRGSQSAPTPTRFSGSNSQPRNLYVVGLPPDMRDDDFRAMFEPFGKLEHCKVLEQPDGMGRKRGFVTFSTHKESLQVMMILSGSFVRGFRIDVSWALRQMEPEQLFSARRGPQLIDDSLQASGSFGRCSVVVDNLDPNQYKTLAQIRAAFATFGTVVSVSVLSPRLTIEVEFTSPAAVAAVLKQDGKVIGEQRLSVCLAPVPQLFMPHTRLNRTWSVPAMCEPTLGAVKNWDDGLIGPSEQTTQAHLPPFDPFGDMTETAQMQAWRRRVNTPLDEIHVNTVQSATRTALRGDCKEFTPSQLIESKSKARASASDIPANRAD